MRGEALPAMYYPPPKIEAAGTAGKTLHVRARLPLLSARSTLIFGYVCPKEDRIPTLETVQWPFSARAREGN